jgi:hypothetical protein
MHWCEARKIDIKTGFGGDANWQAHLDSSVHGRNECCTVKPSKLFFSSKPTGVPSESGTNRNRAQGLPKIEVVT